MKIRIENLGVFKYAEYELSDLTIICGNNNSGKTYATYALFGFLDFFNRGYNIILPEKEIKELFENGTLIVKLDKSQATINKYLKDACNQFIKWLPKIFSAQEKYFTNTQIQIEIKSDEICFPNNFDFSYNTISEDVLHVTKLDSKDELLISLLFKGAKYKENDSLKSNILRILGQTIKKAIFGNVINECFIASAERTGAVIFKDELNIEKNNLLREIASVNEIQLKDILHKIYNISYPLPVRRNIDFVRNLESISKDEGELCKQNPYLMECFNGIVGGEYKVSKDGIYYYPSANKSIKLTLGESASSVRSLLDIYFYLKYIACPGHLLMIDEPELNLHPSSQRKLARVIALLVNLGVKILITTHSDYIIKELNTLIMLKSRQEKTKIKSIMKKQNYREEELLTPEQIKVFISQKAKVLLAGHKRRVLIQSLVPAIITPEFGIEATSFDNTINEMNSLQESIMFS